MMQLLSGHSLTVADRFQPETMSLQLTERTSTATMTLDENAPALAVGDWLRADSGPGGGIVWRVRTVDTQYEKHTRTVTLEHIISTLKDKLMFGEITPATITGVEGATSCTAEQAVAYILGQQSDWAVGTMARTATKPYTFNGDSLFSALEMVSSTLTECVWEYNYSSYPFTINLMAIDNDAASEMRMDRNIRTLKKSVDRSRMYTRFYPIGKNDLHLSTEYVSQNENLYGVIAKTETDQSKETEGELYDWAMERLNRHSHPIVTVTISGEDLSEATGEPLDSFTIGKYCRIPLPEFGTSITERVSKLSYPDITHDPETVTVTLANEVPDVATIYKQEVTEKGGRGGRTGAKKDKDDHAWFVDTEDHVGLIAEAVAGEGADTDWSRVASVIVDGQGVHQRVQYAEGQIVQQWSAIEATESRITLEVASAVSDVRSTITQTADQIRSDVSASESTIYTSLSQTASGIRADLVSTAENLYSYIDATASYLRTFFVSGANKVFIQDTDPRGDPSYIPKEGDLWIESTSHGTWDGASGFDWDHDVDYDWSQVQGAKLWGWQNNQWELISDQQQVVTMSDVEETADRYVNLKVKLAINDEGNLSVYLSRLEQTAEMIRGEVQDYAQSLGSTILQTASQIRSEVHASESQLYSVLNQTASGIIARVHESSNIYSGRTAPTGTADKPLKANDLWVEGIAQRNWSDIDDLIAWVDDENYDWSETQGSKVHVYDGTKWVEVLDERVLMNDTDFQVLSDGIHQVSRSIETIEGGLNAYIGRLEVTSKNMKLDFTDRYRQLNSNITATASQLRSEYNSTASSLGSSITQTASQIRSEVHAAQSTIYSSITQTASSIRMEVANTASGLRSAIEQTAGQITLSVSAAESTIYSSIQQTASQIRLHVANVASGLQSSITQNANSISMVVDGNGIKPAAIVSAINDGGSSIIISADHINLDGYVKATDITANLIQSKISLMDALGVKNMSVGTGGTVRIYSSSYGSYVDLGYSTIIPLIKDLKMTTSGNSCTLYKKSFIGGTNDWVQVGTFSRAVSSWSVGWSGGTFTATAQPQNQSTQTGIYAGSASWSGKTVTIPIMASVNGVEVSTGRSVSATYSAGGIGNVDTGKMQSSTFPGVLSGWNPQQVSVPKPGNMEYSYIKFTADGVQHSFYFA